MLYKFSKLEGCRVLGLKFCSLNFRGLGLSLSFYGLGLCVIVLEFWSFKVLKLRV
jgi:hypothetical protein